MVCKNCGTYDDTGAKFCANCGANLVEQEAAPVTPVAEPVAQNPVFNNAPVQNAPLPGKGMAIASLVLGIVSFLCFPIVTGVLAIIFGGVAKSKGYTGGMATAGLICGILGLALWVLMLMGIFPSGI